VFLTIFRKEELTNNVHAGFKDDLAVRGLRRTLNCQTPKKDTTHEKNGCQTVNRALQREVMQLYMEKKTNGHCLSNVRV
jgi:hypothetical protein